MNLQLDEARNVARCRRERERRRKHGSMESKFADIDVLSFAIALHVLAYLYDVPSNK